MFREDAFRLELLLLVPTIIAIYFGNDGNFNIICGIAYALILIIESLNTCVEKICDLVTEEFDIKVMEIKDIGSFAVSIALVFYFISFGLALIV